MVGLCRFDISHSNLNINIMKRKWKGSNHNNHQSYHQQEQEEEEPPPPQDPFLIFGYTSRLFRDDTTALSLEKHNEFLIPHPFVEGEWIDRFDVRNLEVRDGVEEEEEVVEGIWEERFGDLFREETKEDLNPLITKTAEFVSKQPDTEREGFVELLRTKHGHDERFGFLDVGHGLNECFVKMVEGFVEERKREEEVMSERRKRAKLFLEKKRLEKEGRS